MTTANLFLFNAAAIGNDTPDEELVRGILAGDTEEFAVLMRRHSQRLYRVCRSVVAKDAEAEKAVQQAYLRAYRHLGQFKGDCEFVTWLTKLAIYEALMWRRPSTMSLQEFGEGRGIAMRPRLVAGRRDLEEQPMNRNSASLLEEAIDSLPTNYRTVFVLRDIEKLSSGETAATLLLSRETVEGRLMRSRRMLQERLGAHVLEQPSEQVLTFRGDRSAGLIDRVVKIITQRAGQKYSATALEVATP